MKSPPRLTTAIAGTIAATALWLAATALGAGEVIGLGALRWLWLAIVLGAILGAIGLGRWLTGAAVTTIGLLLLVSWVPFFGGLARGLIRSDSLPARPADAVIVLSAAVSTDGRLSPTGVDRLLEGIRLVNSGAAPRLVVSRVWARDWSDGLVSSDRDQHELTALLGSVESHLLDSVGTTRLEAERAKSLLDRQHWTKAIVVTSPVHTRRACAAFERVGIVVTCRASPDRTVAITTQRSALDRTAAFSQWLYETLGWWKYRMMGWVGGTRESATPIRE